MGGEAIIDSGATLALLDRTDQWHRRCADAFRQLRLPLWTSEAVLTELFHLVGDDTREVRAAWKFVRSGALTIAPMGDDDLPLLDALMHQYRDSRHHPGVQAVSLMPSLRCYKFYKSAPQIS